MNIGKIDTAFCCCSLLFQLSLEQLAKLGVQCLKPDYIAEYLSKSEVQAEAFYISDVRPFMTKPNR